MNAKLNKAVAIFNSLGWQHITPTTILQQPLGEKEQQKIALEGLKSGEWGAYVKTDERTYQWQDFIECNKEHLALFAIRLGVSTSRCIDLAYYVDFELLLPVITAKGENFALDFIRSACVSRRRPHEHTASVFGCLAVQLVDSMNLAIPESNEYIKDWSVFAAIALGLPAELNGKKIKTFPTLAQIERRFIEHLKVGIAVNAPATGPFAAVLKSGIKQGWINVEQAIELIFLALDVAIRPGDRKVWLEILQELNVPDSQLCQRAPALIPLLATGEAAVINQLAPILIPSVDDELLIEVMIACLSTKIKSVKKLVLKTALTRKIPHNAEAFSPWLASLLEEKDTSINSLTNKLMLHWQIDAPLIEQEPSTPQGLWRETPPLWQLPPFELGPVSPEALTELTSQLVTRKELAHDNVVERFLAVANALAYKDPQAARASLAGLKLRMHELLSFIVYWRNEEDSPYGFDREDREAKDVLTARDYIVCRSLDKIPCLLSTPSMSDLSITVSDLCQRLEKYQQQTINVLEADLYLALTRLDIATQTPQTVKKLNSLNVPVMLQSGQKMPLDAGTIVLQYLADPIQEPTLAPNEQGYLRILQEFSAPQSLSSFPNRFKSYYYLSQGFTIFPLWGDCALSTSVYWGEEYEHNKGIVFRQIVQRRTPLPAGAAINLLAAQRSGSPYAVADMAEAVQEAWQRGLLIPGIADVSLLGWTSGPPTHLASLAQALTTIAQQGLLSVIWPILDSLVIASLNAPRLIAGTAEIVGAIAELLPEVQLAVDKGLTDKSQLQLLGVRALANKGGSSSALKVAQTIIAQLPEQEQLQPTPSVIALNQTSTPADFEQIWPYQEDTAAKPATVPEDNVSIVISRPTEDKSSKLFKSLLFTLTLPNITDRVFQIVKLGWYYDLEMEGQCEAYSAPTDNQKFIGDKQTAVWLHWDSATQALVVENHRNWIKSGNGPLSNTEKPEFSRSLITVMIGLLAQDNDNIYYIPKLFRNNVQAGKINANTMREAIVLFLQYPELSPAKLTRILEEQLNLLPVCWPVLTESVKFSGEKVQQGEKLPAWTNRILDISIRYASYLKEAAIRGYIPESEAQWQGLSDIAEAKIKSTAIKKAQLLLTLLK